MTTLLVVLAVIGSAVASAYNNDHRIYQRADVMEQGGGGKYQAKGAKLVRTDHSVELRWSVKTPKPGSYTYPSPEMVPPGAPIHPPISAGYPEVYTLWLFAFDHPELCSDGVCDGNDIGDTPARGSVYQLDGEIAREHRLRMQGKVRLGQHAVNGPGLANPKGAELHVAMAPHGKALTGAQLVHQLNTCGRTAKPRSAYSIAGVQMSRQSHVPNHHCPKSALMPILELANMTWEDVAATSRDRLIAILPIGATEAHGPHLPIATDVIIAEAMARRGAARLAQRDLSALILPSLSYAPAAFAASFSGTISLRPETLRALIVDIGCSLQSQGVGTLALANAHLDPGHIGAIYEAKRALTSQLDAVVFPDVTRKPWALRLGDEFRSGACHAGQYESSIVMAERPELVDDDVRRTLAANPQSLSRAIRDGKQTFVEAGGPRAYFGDPAAATADEGTRTIDILGAILEEAVIEAHPDLASRR